MERTGYFSPGPYQYLYCLYSLPDDRRTAKGVMEFMGTSGSTTDRNIRLLRERGLLIKRGRVHALTEAGLNAVGMDGGTLEDLTFWLADDLNCKEDEARRLAIDFLCRMPIVTVRVLAARRALGAALSRAGAPADAALSALPPGRNEALFSVRGPAGRNKERTESGGRTRAPAAFVVGDGLCALELYDAHIRRIAAVAMPHGNRTIPRRVLYVPGGGTEPVVIPVCVGRWHIRGDAVIGGSRDGKLTGRVRVFAENARGKRYPAEILLGFADNTANGAALYGGKNDNKRTD